MFIALVTTIAAAAGAASSASNTYVALSTTTSPRRSIRHCSYVLYTVDATTEANTMWNDFLFTMKPMSESGDIVELESKNFPSMVITNSTATGVAANRLGLIERKDITYLDAASWHVVRSAARTLSLMQVSTGLYLSAAAAGGPKGSCAHSYKQPGDGNVVLLPKGTTAVTKAAQEWMEGSVGPPPPPPVAYTVTTGSPPTHTLSPLSMGCHSDSGFSHEPRGFYSQLIVGDSFGENNYTIDGAWKAYTKGGTIERDASPDAIFHGVASRKLTMTKDSGSDRVALANRGLGSAGMFFEKGKPYDGFVWLRGVAGAGAAAKLTVSLETWTGGTRGVTTTLGATTTTVPTATAGGWTQFNFSLTPTADTPCVGVDPGDAAADGIDCGNPISSIGHTCIRCSGQIAFSLMANENHANSAVLLNYAFVEPGQWGRVAGISVLSAAASNLKQMGITAIRQGGSFASSGDTEWHDNNYYQWQKWTGPAWKRPSRGAKWQAGLLSGWGPFEFIDMCVALGITPIVTTTENETPEGFADLVEYCHGDASTKMGKQRIEVDGHPAPYNVTIFELGNEQYNPNYVSQVAAMEARATTLGMAGTIKYMFPLNAFLNDTDVAKAMKFSPRIDSSMLADIHIGGGGAIEESRSLFAKHDAQGFACGTVNAETNAHTHTHARALSEGADLNDWFNAEEAGLESGRIVFRAASFCAGDATTFDAWDQGISFFLPNMTWLQPPGWVHHIIDQTWQPNALRWSSNATTSDNTTFSAQISDDRQTMVLRIVNKAASRVSVVVNTNTEEAGGLLWDDAAAIMWTLASDDLDMANSAGTPKALAPVQSTLQFVSGATIVIKAQSVNAIVLQLQV